MPNLFDQESDAVDDLLEETGQEILYNGVLIRAIVRRGPDRKRLPSLDAFAAAMTIRVRRDAITTTAKGTPVMVNDEAWKVEREAHATTLTVVIELMAKAGPVPRRSL